MERYDVDPQMVRDSCREMVLSLRGVIKEQVGAATHPLAHHTDRFCRTMAREIEHQTFQQRLREADEAERAVRRALSMVFHNPVSYGG